MKEGFYAFAAVVVVVGWLINLGKVIQIWSDGFTLEFGFRILGLAYAPLGAILGFFVPVGH